MISIFIFDSKGLYMANPSYLLLRSLISSSFWSSWRLPLSPSSQFLSVSSVVLRQGTQSTPNPVALGIILNILLNGTPQRGPLGLIALNMS